MRRGIVVLAAICQPDFVAYPALPVRVRTLRTALNYTPNVIEPSFGIGRVLYCLLEQNFWAREGDEQRVVLSLPAIVAPIKVVVLPISGQPEFQPFIDSLGMYGLLAGGACAYDILPRARMRL